jgi:glycosyltransferase involved in cell wall biosynthesis
MQEIDYSVIIATHNRPTLVQRAVQSVRKQTHASCQLLVVSDMDDPLTYAATTELLGPHDFFVQRKGKPGPAESRNIALQIAAGNHITFLDDDDAFRPDFLEQVTRQITGKSTDAIYYTNFEVIDAQAQSEPTAVDLGPFAVSQVWTKNFIPNNCAIYPGKVLRKIRYDQDIAYEDWDFLLAAHRTNPLVHLPVFGPIIYKNTNTGQAHRGDENTSALLNCYLKVYAKHPPLTAEVADQRRALFASIDLDIDTLVNNSVAMQEGLPL